MKPAIGISMGDYNGIGPEVTLKALLSRDIYRLCKPVLIGSLDVYEWYARRLKIRCLFREVVEVPDRIEKRVIPVIPIRPFHSVLITPGVLCAEAGKLAAEAIIRTIELCKKGGIQAMVTAPVSKKAMEMSGYDYPGQTELLAEKTNSNNVMMMLLAGSFRVGLATVHIPLKRVSSAITTDILVEKLSVMHLSLGRDFRISRPQIAVLGLNPHAGENGKMGKEEEKIIIPALEKARRKRYIVDGPFPSDGFFGSGAYRNYDAILAMYHDQGLIPLKMAGFEKGINYSSGLNIVRTSPDHGTGFDIAGKGIANPNSMLEAIRLAVSIAHNRKKYHA